MSRTETLNVNKSFALFLQSLEGGALHEDLTEAVHKCVSEISDAATDRGGKQKSSITLKIEFSIDAKDRIVEVQSDLKTKVPEVPRGRGGLFFVTAENNLTKENPRQRTFDEFTKAQESRQNMDVTSAG